MSDYNADSIEVLEGLEPVRKRPGMYTETNRPNHLAQEVIDNGVDEALAGHANRVDVTLHDDGSISVSDNGRGMPTDMHKKKKKPAYEVIMTSLHSGGKFNSGSYQYSGGLHGVGVSVVNALSKKLVLSIELNGVKTIATFSAGVLTDTREEKALKKAHGTTIQFWPDASYFETARFHRGAITQLMRSKAVLCPGLTMNFLDEESGESEQWYYENGLAEFFHENQAEAEDPIPEAGRALKAQWEGGECDAMFSFSGDGQSVLSDSFANLIPTPQGGAHLASVRKGISLAVRNVADQRDLVPKNVTLSQEDVAGALNLMVSIKLRDPQFAGQTKERLSGGAFTTELTNQIKDRMEHYLHRYADEADAIIQVAINRAQQRNKSNKKATRKKATSGLAMPSKLSDCTESSVENAEIFLVEGDSAGGSAKQARDRRFQAIMPLRGKILNSWEVEPADLFSSQEVADITTIIGMDPGSTDLSGLRYNKVCVLADADSDGLHIATLLCALFFKHFPALVEKGHFYIALPPLYRIDLGKEVFYAHDEGEKDKILKKLEKRKGTPNVQRFKGLGEMNPEQLKETVMDRESRNLVQVRAEDPVSATVHMNMLLGKKNADARKVWLQEKGGRVVGEV